MRYLAHSRLLLHIYFHHHSLSRTLFLSVRRDNVATPWSAAASRGRGSRCRGITEVLLLSILFLLLSIRFLILFILTHVIILFFVIILILVVVVHDVTTTPLLVLIPRPLTLDILDAADVLIIIVIIIHDARSIGQILVIAKRHHTLTQRTVGLRV